MIEPTRPWPTPIDSHGIEPSRARSEDVIHLRQLFPLLLMLLAAAIAGGCTQKKKPTPGLVAESYHTLRDSLMNTPPGAAMDRWAEFLHFNDRYTIADTVYLEIGRLRAEADDGYHTARELARRGEFEQAEVLLLDLATHLPDTPAGASAREYLAFDFGIGRAQWLLARQRFEESETVARELLSRDLTPTQSNQVEAILDNLGYVAAANSQVERSETRNACRHLSIMLFQQFIEDGRYPSRFSIADIKDWAAYDSDLILRGLSAIENYETTGQGYSFEGVSVNGAHRFHVTDGSIQNLSN